MNFADTRHLIARTGIGANLEQIESLKAKSRDECIDSLLNARIEQAPSAPVFHNRQQIAKLRKQGGESRKRGGKLRRENRRKLQAWLSEVLLKTRNPLHLRLTLFWHNHFTSGLQKVPAELMLQQHQSFRGEALGRFDQMLHAIVTDPAMLFYLDNVRNRKGRINENFARELLELFTLGEGNYSESDIRNAAYALTGWRLNHDNGTVYFDVRRHDDRAVNFLGHSGTLSSADIIDILLERPETARRVVTKLWHCLISDRPPDSRLIHAWGAEFQAGNYDIKHLLQKMLQSESFWAAENRGTLTKSPIDIVIGSARELGLTDFEPRLLARWCRRLGQDLLNPPTVSGWPGGRHWIDTQTLLERQLFLRRAVSAAEITRQTGSSMNGRPSLALPPVHTWEAWLLPIKNERASMPGTNVNPEQYLAQLLLDPRYQLR